MKVVALAVVLGAMLLATVGLLAWGWASLGVDVPLIGWIALGVGAGLSFLLGVGLMALSFYSARRGYDDAASGGDDDARA